jgi:uncharacterized protein (TIGR02452 family)
VDVAVAGTRLYEPSQLEALEVGSDAPAPCRASIEVTGETTAVAARRIGDALALNFASAKNPGGGFLRGAKAQEEDLARCSALYECQIGKQRYYAANRACGTLLYTDHLIYSPRVPFFRDEDLELLDEPFLASVVTSPAPNAGEVMRNERTSIDEIAETLHRRAGHVLAVAKHHGHTRLVLGAWGCGVFRNDPVMVAETFHRHLNSERFAAAFERVVIAVYDRSKRRENHRAFEARFG